MTRHMVPLRLYYGQIVGKVEVETHDTRFVVFNPELMLPGMRAAILPKIPDDWTGTTKRTDYECEDCGSKAWVHYRNRPNPKAIPCCILSCGGTCVPKVCGKDMGGVWFPDRFGIKVFVPLKCNHHSGHGGLCCYTDTKSGMVVHTGALFPSLTVDPRGCVVSTTKTIDRELIDRKIVGEMSPELRCAAKRSGTIDTVNVQAIAAHQAKICECYFEEKP